MGGSELVEGCVLTGGRGLRDMVGEARGVTGEEEVGTGGEVRGDNCCGGGETTVGAGAIVVGEVTEELKADRERFWLIFLLRSLCEGNLR